ncbi:MAG: ATPase, T2SS/T4P/T4SS family [Desulfobacterales bacterium]
MDLEKSLFQSKVVRKIPERFARQHYAIPIYQMGDTVTVATPIPDNIGLKKQIEQIIGGPVNLVFALPQDIEWAIENEYQTNSALYEFFTKIATSRVFDAENPISEKTFEKIAGKESINQLHVSLILLGITENASEIQIDPEQDVARVNFIISGQFHERLQIEKNVFRQLVKNIQNMAKITEAKDQSPRYSRILFPTPGKKFDIQFLSLPSEFGEKIYLKLMDRAALDRPPRLAVRGYLSVRNLHLLRNHLPSPKAWRSSWSDPGGLQSMAYAVLRDICDNNNNNG